MKTILNNASNASNIANGFTGFFSEKTTSSSTKNDSGTAFPLSTIRSVITKENLLKPKAKEEMTLGQIPDLWAVCLDLFNTFFSHEAPYSALQFVQVLNKLQSINQDEIRRFLVNPETNHVLIQNDLLKVVLIHWKPGKISSIHGHPSGGCAFKVLQGQVEELRYTTNKSPQLLSSSTYIAGSIAYIDDQMGYHAVGNPFNSSAVSLHAYTPGSKK